MDVEEYAVDLPHAQQSVAAFVDTLIDKELLAWS